MAIEIKPGAKSFATLYQIQPKNNTSSDKFEIAFSERLQALGVTNDVETTISIANSDKVVFTNVIQEMRRRIDASSEQSVDLEKVARIRKAIEEGTYVVDADRLAGKILQYAF